MLVIKNGKIIDPELNQERENKTLWIDNDGKIIDLNLINQENFLLNNNIQEIDATGCWISPGLIDIHCHLRDPGFQHKENIISGSESAMAGGFTTICPMANTNPVVDNLETLEYIQNKSSLKSKIQILQHCSLSKSLLGQELTDIYSLYEAGAVAFSDDGRAYNNSKLLYNGLKYCSQIGAVIVSHAENQDLFNGGSMREGLYSLKLGYGGIASCFEASCIASQIEILRNIKNAKLHFSHISTKQSVLLIKKAKGDGLNVTAETTPHHLILQEKDCEIYGANAKMNPPLGTQEDQEALIEALKTGVIDCLATDHAPHSSAEKTISFEDSAFGITGFETAVSIYLEKLFHSKILSPLEIIRALTLNPVRALNINKNTRNISLQAGSQANITIINPELEWEFSRENTRSKSFNSPFYGKKFKGKAIKIIINNQVFNI